MNKQQISKVLRDYHWMIETIKEERKELNEVSTGIAQYGIESTLPKPQGTTSDVVSGEAIRREKKSKWIVELEIKVKYIQDHLDYITEEREKAVLHYTLEGWSIRKIALHMGLSHTHIRKIVNGVAVKLAG